MSINQDFPKAKTQYDRIVYGQKLGYTAMAPGDAGTKLSASGPAESSGSKMPAERSPGHGRDAAGYDLPVIDVQVQRRNFPGYRKDQVYDMSDYTGDTPNVTVTNYRGS